MTAVNQVTGEITGEEVTERTLIGMLKGVDQLRRESTRLARAYHEAKKPLGKWLDEHPGEKLYDPETRTFAVLKGGGDNQVLDVRGLAQNEPAALLALAELALLKLDVTAFKAQEMKFQEGAIVRRYIMKEPRTARLIVDREDE